MLRLRRFLFPAAFCALSLAIPAGAQSTKPAEIAARVDRHYNNLHSLEVHFVQNYEGMGMHRHEAGVLLLKKPGRMRWTYTDPDGKLFILDGHDGFFYSPGESEAQKVPEKQLDDLRSPLQFLLGHTELEKELKNLTVTSSGGGSSCAGWGAERAGAAGGFAEDYGGAGRDDPVDDHRRDRWGDQYFRFQRERVMSRRRTQPSCSRRPQACMW